MRLWAAKLLGDTSENKSHIADPVCCGQGETPNHSPSHGTAPACWWKLDKERPYWIWWKTLLVWEMAENPPYSYSCRVQGGRLLWPVYPWPWNTACPQTWALSGGRASGTDTSGTCQLHSCCLPYWCFVFRFKFFLKDCNLIISFIVAAEIS